MSHGSVWPSRAPPWSASRSLRSAPENGAGAGYEDRLVAGYTKERAATAAGEHGIRLEVVKLPQAKRGLALLLRAGG